MSIRPYTGEYLVSPVALHMGLNWCTHACWYCSREDMPITLADLSTKPVGDIAIGDTVLGWSKETVAHAPRGKHGTTTSAVRRFAEARVEDVFTRDAPVIRVILEDGNEVHCTPDHHWFTGRVGAWEYAPLIGKRGLRPAAALVRLNVDTAPAIRDLDAYLLGYLRGYAEGDGTWMPQGTWRFASKDPEPLARVTQALHRMGCPVPAAIPWPDGMQAITLPVGHDGNACINGFDLDSIDYWRGWLGGIYDAEGNTPARLPGNRSGEALRIAQIRTRNPLTYDRIQRALRRFGFGYVAEPASVRLQGGRTEACRFVQLARPAIDRKQNPLIGTGHKGMVKPVRVVAVEEAGTAPVVSFRTSTGNYVSGGYLSRNCFANANRPGRRADYAGIQQFLGKVARQQPGRDIAATLALAGHPILASNDSDPFAASNGQQNLDLMQAMMDMGLRFSFQTRGGKGAVEMLEKHPPTMVYISFTTDQPDTAKRNEPGAPPHAARMELALAAKAAGHHVVAGINPFYPPWWDDIEGFLAWLAAHDIRHAWIGEPHLNYMQVRAMPEKTRERFGDEIRYFTAGHSTRPPAWPSLRHLCNQAGINTFTGATSEHGRFWEPYFARGYPFWPTLEGFFDYLRSECATGPVAFTFAVFDAWANRAPIHPLRSAAFKEYLSGIGRSIRNIGGDQRADSLQQVHHFLWRIHEFPTRLRHDDIFIGTEGGAIATDEQGRFVLVYAPDQPDNDTGRFDLDACADWLGLGQEQGTTTKEA